MSRDIFSWYLINVVLMALVLVFSVHAGEVEVTDPKSSKNEALVVGVLEEGGKFYHDRDYIMTGVPEEYQGFTSIMTSADTQGNVDVQWTFEIDRPAYVYIAFDSRATRPEDRDQDPKDWFSDGFTDTGEVVVLDAPHPPTDYWVYRSNEPYPKGEVTLDGIAQGHGAGTLWVMFVEEADLAVSSQEKLAARWGEIKSLK